MPSHNRIKVSDLLNDVPPTRPGGRVPTRVHDDVQVTQCDLDGCTRVFASPNALLIHQKRVHAGPTKYACRSCNATFSSSPNLSKHVKSVHERARPFKCNLCTSAFAFKDGLSRHISIVHEQLRPYFCSHCALKFKTKSHLTKHLLSVHNEIYSKTTSQDAAASSSSRN